MEESINSKGEYALYENGKLLRYEGVTLIDGKKVVNSYVPFVKAIKEAAFNDKVILKINEGFRTWDEQYGFRKRNVIDKDKMNDKEYLVTADNGLFNPRTAKPGYSNHQNGNAIDFNVPIDTYRWMVKNAKVYRFIRTVPSEKWHWQYLPNMDMFAFVKQNDPTWDKLV
jgi:LAS superfamily LD-carboxypeptidase LdcB